MPSAALRPGERLRALRAATPLVHNITNYVVMHSTANALLAVGAAPVMAHAPEEAADMARLASALVLNIGTLSAPWVASMRLAGRAAADKGIPIVLDPVGAGATVFRTETARALLNELPVAALRGNAGEIFACAGESGLTRGVDSAADSLAARELAEALARTRKTVVAVTGPTDVVADGTRVLLVHNGHPRMGRVTGTGCAASAIIGAFLAVGDYPLLDAAAALAYYGLAGERAAAREVGLGQYWAALVDELDRIRPEELDAGARVVVG